jgi:GntR family transcriptional regulator
VADTSKSSRVPVTASSPIPLYYQIANVLQSRIFSGRYPPGTRLGTEKAFAAEFGVSRITVQKALDELEREGVIVRARARGTFVAEQVRPTAPVELHGFLDDVILLGEFGETLRVERDEMEAPPAVAEHLGVAAGTCVTRIRRLRAPHGVANTWVVNYLPLDVGRQFSLDDLRTASVIQCIDRVPGLRLTQGREVITAHAADAETATQLGVEPGTPILLVERELQTQSGRTVDFAQFHYLGHPQSVRLSRVRR